MLGLPRLLSGDSKWLTGSSVGRFIRRAKLRTWTRDAPKTYVIDNRRWWVTVINNTPDKFDGMLRIEGLHSDEDYIRWKYLGAANSDRPSLRALLIFRGPRLTSEMTRRVHTLLAQEAFLWSERALEYPVETDESKFY